MRPSLSDLPMVPAARFFAQALRGLDPRNWKTDNPTEAIALGIHSLRSGLFFAESFPVFWTQRLRGDRKIKPPTPAAIKTTLSRLRELLERDAEQIGLGVAPLSVLTPRDPFGHGTRFLRILADSQSISNRRRMHRTKEFCGDAERWLDNLPAYYRRNFHYQTDGYLSDRSADLYEHQVELLFRGGADAMRRMILAPMKAHFKSRSANNRSARNHNSENHDGEGLRFLELGSGTGGGALSIARAFPRAKITCLDLSYPYTKHARQQLREFERVECIQGDASVLEFGDDRFDAVYSIFLFHELPLPVRELVLDEAQRVLRPGAFFGLVDSLQKGDDEELDWALEFFPHAYHEPYYAHYASNPMEALIEEAGFTDIESRTGYLAKCVSARASG